MKQIAPIASGADDLAFSEAALLELVVKNVH